MQIDQLCLGVQLPVLIFTRVLGTGPTTAFALPLSSTLAPFSGVVDGQRRTIVSEFVLTLAIPDDSYASFLVVFLSPPCLVASLFAIISGFVADCVQVDPGQVQLGCHCWPSIWRQILLGGCNRADTNFRRCLAVVAMLRLT